MTDSAMVYLQKLLNEAGINTDMTQQNWNEQFKVTALFHSSNLIASISHKLVKQLVVPEGPHLPHQTSRWVHTGPVTTSCVPLQVIMQQELLKASNISMEVGPQSSQSSWIPEVQDVISEMAYLCLQEQCPSIHMLESPDHEGIMRRPWVASCQADVCYRSSHDCWL